MALSSLLFSLFQCLSLHWHDSLLNRWYFTNIHFAPSLVSILSAFFLFSISHFVSPFHILLSFVLFDLYSLSYFHFYFLPFISLSLFIHPFCIHIFLFFSIVFSCLSTTLFLPLLLKMMPLIKRMVRSSHSATSVSFYLSSLHSSPCKLSCCNIAGPQRPLLSV